MSKEHIWPDWLRRYVPRNATTTRHTRPGPFGLMKGKLHRPGDPASQRLRCVCEKCNNGWMSHLQIKAKPILVGLISNTWESLDRDAQTTFSAWATMFTTVFEMADPSSAAVSPEERSQFRKDLIPSTNWTVSFTNYNGPDYGPSISHHEGYSRKAPGRPCLQYTSAVIGKLVFQTFYTPTHAIWLPDRTYHRKLQLHQTWPVHEDVLVQCGETVAENDVLEIYQRLATMLGAKDQRHSLFARFGNMLTKIAFRVAKSKRTGAH